MADFDVRAIERGDRAQWAPLWRAYLDFYRAAVSAEATDATWARIFDPLEPVHAVVAARGDRLIGFSHYLFQRSTWLVAPRCYLQDLYVSPAERGRRRRPGADRRRRCGREGGRRGERLLEHA